MHTDNALQLASNGHEVVWAEDTNRKSSCTKRELGAFRTLPRCGQIDWSVSSGFMYKRYWGTPKRFDRDSGYNRTAAWLIRWIERDVSYSPQPYLHLAEVLDAAGQHKKSVRVRVANRERERAQYPVTTFGGYGLPRRNTL